MAYVNVADWKPDQVTDWLKGLDSCILPYIHSFLNNQVNGQQLLSITYDDLEKLGVYKLGHQELILEAVEHLQNFHYELDRETLQLLALRVSCLAHSLYNELRHNHCNSHLVSTQTLADVANIVTAVKPLVCWLDRPPFSGHLEYSMLKPELLSLSLEMATSGQRDRFAEHPVEEIKNSCGKLAALADSIIQDTKDPLLLQPASLDLATLKKRSSDDLGFYIVPSFHGIHQIGDLKCNSAAHQCGKIEPGDEIVQINYQTVVGWQVKQVMALFEESPTEVLLTIKKRPKHTKVYGQIYMKPYRLPSKKKTQRSYTRWHENIPSPRPELLTIPDFEMPLPKCIVNTSVESTVSDVGVVHLPSSSSEEEGEGVLGTNSSPTSVRIYLPKPRIPVQRRATITGASPISKTAPIDLQQFWLELKLEREWRGGDTIEDGNEKPGRSQLIQDCEEAQLQLSQLSPRKYSSYDSLKTKPDLVSSCQPDNLLMFSRNCKKSTESVHDEVFRTTENSPRKKSSDSDDVFRTPDSSGLISKKSSISDDVFTSVDSNNVNLNITKAMGDNNCSISSNISDSCGNDSSEYRKISLKEKIEMFSKGCPSSNSDSDKIRCHSTGSSNPNINRNNNKPKVPARTFRLSPEKTVSSTSPQVFARVLNNKDELINSNYKANANNSGEGDNLIKAKERGKLDKSHSTPAYDFNIDINIDQQYEKNKEIMIGKLHSDKNKNETKSNKLADNSKIGSEQISPSNKTETVEEVHGQMVETINQHILKMNDESDLVDSRIQSLHISAPLVPKMKDQKTGSDVNEADQFNVTEENEKTEKIGKILETISSSIAEHRRKELEKDGNFTADKLVCEEDLNQLGSSDSGGADLSKTISQVCQEEILQTYNPSSYVSKVVCESDLVKSGNSNSENSNRGVLPVPPRIRVPVPPPVLPDVTITTSPSHSCTNIYGSNSSNNNNNSCNSSRSSTPPEMPKRKPVSNMEFIDNPVKPVAPATFPRHQKPDPQRPLTPPEPPPRPTPPVRGACYRAMLAAKSMGKSASAASSVASPKALRKKNPLLAKMRNVSVVELGQCDCQGWLQQRCRKSSGQWNTGWFVIKGTTFYGFANKESQKAHCLISLPGFTVSPADEVKSRKYAFKVYHTGTVFYFAANSQEELTAWLDCFSMATMIQDTLSNSILFSESEGELTADEVETESCFRSPKMKKLATLLSGSPSSPTRSHQNLAENKSTSETQKKFSSLKKFGSRKTSSSPNGSSSSGPGSISDADGCGNVLSSTTGETNSSLDRKYLRFLDRGQIRPVPTAQFRSYRRVAPPLPRQHPHPLHQSAESVLTLDSSVGNPVLIGGSSGTDGGGTRVGIVSPAQPSHIVPIGSHHLHHHIQTHHRRPPDMADYRLASLSKNRQRAVEEHDTTGFITLEALMLARQEEERRQTAQMNATASAPQPNIVTPPVPQPRSSVMTQGHQQQSVVQQRNNISGSSSVSSMSLLSSHGADSHKIINNASRSVNNNGNNNLSNRSTSGSLPSSSRNFINNSNNNNNNNSNNNTYPYRSATTSCSPAVVRVGDDSHGVSGSSIMKPVRSIFTSHRSHPKPTVAVDYRDGSPEKLWINSLRGNANNSNVHNNSSNINCKRLKKAALYQPPPVAPLDTAGGNSDDSRMQLAFEMFLDQNHTSALDNNQSSRRRSPKVNNVNTSASRLKSLFTGGGGGNSTSSKQDNQKTLLGSPRLHRAIFRNSSRGCGGNGDSGGESLNSPPLSPPEDTESSDVVQCPSSSPSTPDYPGLEYPPVFEPGTYSLSDASTLLSCRNNSNRDDR